MRAIETRYKGYRFRSRLEARWAVFLDALGIPWEYEIEGFKLPHVGTYLPDFLLWGSVFAEVKPDEHRSLLEGMRALVMLCVDTRRDCVLLHGAPTRRWYPIISFVEEEYRICPGENTRQDFIDLVESAHKNRPWCAFAGDNPDDNDLVHSANWEMATMASRGARFEHGEEGLGGELSPYERLRLHIREVARKRSESEPL